jgi:hypothetical protein
MPPPRRRNMLPEYPRSEEDTLDSLNEFPLQAVLRSLAGKMRLLGYLGMSVGALASAAGLFFNPLIVPYYVVGAVAGLLLIRSGNAFSHCAAEDRTDNWLDAIRSLNKYFIFQFVVIGIASIVFILQLFLHIAKRL